MFCTTLYEDTGANEREYSVNVYQERQVVSVKTSNESDEIEREIQLREDAIKAH